MGELEERKQRHRDQVSSFESESLGELEISKHFFRLSITVWKHGKWFLFLKWIVLVGKRVEFSIRVVDLFF